LPFPILFFIGLTLLPEIRFARHHSNLSFRLLIPDRYRSATSQQRGDPFSHPSGSSAGSGKLCRFSLSISFPVFVWVFLAINRSAHPASAGPENVQCRSVFIQFVRALVPRRLLPGHRDQPVFDSRHGRIAYKTFLQAVPLSLLLDRRAAASNQSWGLRANPFPWL